MALPLPSASRHLGRRPRDDCVGRPTEAPLGRTRCVRCIGTTSARASSRSEGARAPSLAQRGTRSSGARAVPAAACRAKRKRRESRSVLCGPHGRRRGAYAPHRLGRCVSQVVCQWMIGDMRVGIADHLGWAVAVTASAGHEVVDRRRVELIEPGLSAAPIHYESRRLDVAATGALVANVRASVVRATSAALDEIATALPAPVLSISLRAWPLDFPDDIAVQRRAPYEARADAIMYRQRARRARTRSRLGSPPL